MREQSTGGIEFPAVHDHVISGIREFSLELRGAFRAEFRECVAKTDAS